MEAHDLALAALSEIATSSSHRRDPGKSRSMKTKTDSDMNNTIDHNIAEELFQQSQVTDAMSSITGDSQDGPNNIASGLQSSQNTDDTPPTSDESSSQGTDHDGQLSQLSTLSQLAAAAEPLASTSVARPVLSVASTSGLKRTADGQVKPALFTSPTSPRGGKIRGHSRNTSAVSTASNSSSKIGELSSELRTRLSYAMVKVNNGWQSNSIDEVESLASQAGSPTSSTSTLHGRRNPLASPKTNIASIQHASSFPSNSIIQAPNQDFDLYSGNDQPSRTYESFWRDHSTSNPAQRSSHALSHQLSLKPPADIRPTPTSRRSHTPKFSKPPTMPGQGSNSSLTSAPRTPNGHPSNAGNRGEKKSLQSHQTAQEQDAMEALLFMSSPGNSGNMGPAFHPPKSRMSPQQSPLRAEFNVQPPLRGAQGRRVGFETTAASISTGSSEAGGYHGKTKQVRSSKTDAIDRMLDEMRDSSSDEEEIVLNYSSPRRVTAARV